MGYDVARWVVVFLFVVGLIFNTGVLWNDVQHIKKDMKYLRERMDKIINGKA